MPIEDNHFARFKETSEANQASLKAMGVACMQVAVPNCPVQTGYLKNSHRIKLDADHVDVGVVADYGGYVHNGTSRQKAQPWLRDASEANRESITAFGVRAWKGALGE